MVVVVGVVAVLVVVGVVVVLVVVVVVVVIVEVVLVVVVVVAVCSWNDNKTFYMLDQVYLLPLVVDNDSNYF